MKNGLLVWVALAVFVSGCARFEHLNSQKTSRQVTDVRTLTAVHFALAELCFASPLSLEYMGVLGSDESNFRHRLTSEVNSWGIMAGTEQLFQVSAFEGKRDDEIAVWYVNGQRIALCGDFGSPVRGPRDFIAEAGSDAQTLLGEIREIHYSRENDAGDIGDIEIVWKPGSRTRQGLRPMRVHISI